MPSMHKALEGLTQHSAMGWGEAELENPVLEVKVHDKPGQLTRMRHSDKSRLLRDIIQTM